MKLLFLSLSSAFGGKLATSQSAEILADFDCTVECYKTLFKDVVKCGSDEEATQEEIDLCGNQAFADFWYSCLGQQCGANLPEGVCAERCIPPLEDAVMKCDGK